MNLIVNYYIDKNKNRQLEYDKCLALNAANQFIRTIYLFTDLNIIPKNDKIKIVQFKTRPTYKDFFLFANKIQGIKILANLDIYFDNSLIYLKSINLENTILTISRNDNISPDSQDVWVWKDFIKPFDTMNFSLGIAGCDNRIAYILKNDNKFSLRNPARQVRCNHLHHSKVRNYINNGRVERILPPYSFVCPEA